jgi:cell division protein FtsZ
MLQIDDFFDQLDPNIDVIWGTATDDSLGEDAKVTILATGMEDDLRNEVQQNAHKDEDDFYEELIPKLYKPVKTKKFVDAVVQELPFEVEVAKEPEPAPTPTPKPEEEVEERVETEEDQNKNPEQPTILK